MGDGRVHCPLVASNCNNGTCGCIFIATLGMYEKTTLALLGSIGGSAEHSLEGQRLIREIYGRGEIWQYVSPNQYSMAVTTFTWRRRQ